MYSRTFLILLNLQKLRDLSAHCDQGRDFAVQEILFFFLQILLSQTFNEKSCEYFKTSRQWNTLKVLVWVFLEVGHFIWKSLFLRPMQTDPTLLANNMQHCWLVVSICMEPQQWWHLLALVAYSLKPVKVLDPRKPTQHSWALLNSETGIFLYPEFFLAKQQKIYQNFFFS